jgi:hypothetical protein
MKSKHVYIKTVSFERNIETGLMELIIESNHGSFVLRDDVLDPTVIGRVYDYIKEKATEVISLYVAEQAQRALEKTSAEQAREALDNIGLPELPKE